MISTPIDPRTAWSPFEPGDSQPWTLALAGHLHRRAGFGASWPELERTLADGPQRSIDRLVGPVGDLAAFQQTYDGYDASAGSALGLSQWWLHRMLHTPHPLLEKMTLFWQSYFPANFSRVKSAALMARHVSTLREHALGSFREMLNAMAHDPAMLVSLGAEDNRKAQPNANFAGELLGRFTVGAGQFSEQDVREAARAFTGFRVLRGELRHFPREHDEGEKTVFGRRGRWTSEDVVRITLDQPATARTVVRKLYRWLISETSEPDDELLEPLAASFAKDYDLARLTESMLRSRLFFSAAAYRQRVKSPVEYALGIAKALEATVPTAPLAEDLAALGQSLHEPPTVAGWPGGPSWLNSFTMLGRGRLAGAMLAKEDRYGGKADPAAVAQRHGQTSPEAVAGFFLNVFLQGDLDPAAREHIFRDAGSARGPEETVRLAHRIVALPEFQLA
ncbi:MAG: DUF1800 family protein [Thermoguttaceae bacterium]|nr:DUF1800 family protein [Thermoguttaceae bacterium]